MPVTTSLLPVHQPHYHCLLVLAGSTAQEVDFQPTPCCDLKSWNQQQLQQHVASFLDTFGGNLTAMALNMYPWQHDAQYVLTSMVSDIRVNCPTSAMAERAAQALDSPVYRSVVTSWPSREVHVFGSPWPAKYAFHCWDSYAFFDYLEDLFPEGPSQADRDFEDVLHRQIVHFVKQGKPEDERWKPYPGHTALVGRQLEVVDEYNKDQCHMWDTNDILPYGWIN